MQDLHQALEHDGFAVLEDALDSDRRSRLVDAVDRVWQERGNGSALHLLGFVGLDPEFVELVDHSQVLELVAGVLGWNVFLYHCHLDVHPRLAAPPEPAWRWHQDGGRQNVELSAPRPLLSLKAAYFLTDVGHRDHGALHVIPGSHRRDRLERPDGETALLVRAGTAVIFDRRLWHARGDNLFGPTRKALWIPTDDDVPLAMRYKPQPCASTSSATWKASPESSSGSR